MNIRVGDETHHHYPAPPVEAVAPSPPQVEPATPSPIPAVTKAIGTIALAAALSGLAGAGVGAAAVPWLMGAFDKPDPPAATAPSDKDTITQIGIR